MGLFPSANDFKAGKGVEKDAPRKTGIGRFFELVGRDMNGMFLANLLTCIGFGVYRLFAEQSAGDAGQRRRGRSAGGPGAGRNVRYRPARAAR